MRCLSATRVPRLREHLHATLSAQDGTLGGCGGALSASELHRACCTCASIPHHLNADTGSAHALRYHVTGMLIRKLEQRGSPSRASPSVGRPDERTVTWHLHLPQRSPRRLVVQAANAPVARKSTGGGALTRAAAPAAPSSGAAAGPGRAAQRLGRRRACCTPG